MEDALAQSYKIENYIIILKVKTKLNRRYKQKEENKIQKNKRSWRKYINYKNILNI